jgi:hypothetical protein
MLFWLAPPNYRSGGGQGSKMATYKKIADGHYEVSTDKGSYEVKPNVVGVAINLSNVRRGSTFGNDFAKPEKGFELSRNISAAWEPDDDYHFELISEEDGEKRVRLPVHVQIIVDGGLSHFAHWTPVGDIEEQFYLQVCVPQETFDWLWDEVQRRPSAVVSMRCKMMSLLAGIEGSMWYEGYSNAIRLERGQHLKILSSTIHVSDPEPKSESKPEDLEVGSKIEQFERTLLIASDNTWLKRIFFVLTVIAVILFFRR